MVISYPLDKKPNVYTIRHCKFFTARAGIPAMTGCLILPDTTELTVLMKLDFPSKLGPVRRNRNSGMVPEFGDLIVTASSRRLLRNYELKIHVLVNELYINICNLNYNYMAQST